jgi:hypothetical protein
LKEVHNVGAEAAFSRAVAADGVALDGQNPHALASLLFHEMPGFFQDSFLSINRGA